MKQFGVIALVLAFVLCSGGAALANGKSCDRGGCNLPHPVRALSAKIHNHRHCGKCAKPAPVQKSCGHRVRHHRLRGCRC